jgi:hypothetical protein
MVGLRASINPTLEHVGHYFAVEDDEQWSCMPAHRAEETQALQRFHVHQRPVFQWLDPRNSR